MRLTARGMAVGSSLMILAGCAGQQIATDYSPAVGFADYRTFALVTPPDSASHHLIDDRVRNAVEAQLMTKGLTPTDRDLASLYVGYGVVDRTHKEISSTGNNWGWGPAWGWQSWRWGVAWPMTVQRSIETYTDGTVVVCLVDAKTHRVVWRSEASAVVPIPIANPEKATRDIDQAVAKMFAKYPPNTGA